MAKAKRDPSQGQGLYERDFFAWTQQQAELLRREAIRGAITDLDLENLAEEIDSLGKCDRRALASQLARITEHLLKLQFGHAYEPRAGWKNSVDAHRAKARRILADSPGLKGELISLLNEGYEDGRRRAARLLGVDRGPVTLPEVCPYTIDQLLDRDWWPRRG
jgi:hypothetical protein